MELKITAVIVFLIANLFTIGLVSFQSSIVNETYAASSNATNATYATSNTMQAALQKEALKLTPPSSSNDAQITTTKNSIVLGNPSYIEYIKSIRQQPLVLNTGLHAVGMIFIGKGTVKGTSFVQTEGKALIIPLSQGIADIVGGGLIRAANGEGGNATYSFREIGHYNPSTQTAQGTANQIMNGTGADHI